MPILARPAVAAAMARVMQRAALLASRRSGAGHTFAGYPGATRELVIPTTVAPAPVVVYRPPAGAGAGPDRPPVHVNFHGGGYVMPQLGLDDALCRFLAAEAGAVVLDVDYAVAPQHSFPGPARQAFEVVRWVADHGAEQGWDGGRLTVGGQSAGGALAAAAARQALEEGGPAIALQVLHYPPLDLVNPVQGEAFRDRQAGAQALDERRF